RIVVARPSIAIEVDVGRLVEAALRTFEASASDGHETQRKSPHRTSNDNQRTTLRWCDSRCDYSPFGAAYETRSALIDPMLVLITARTGIRRSSSVSVTKKRPRCFTSPSWSVFSSTTRTGVSLPKIVSIV